MVENLISWILVWWKYMVNQIIHLIILFLADENKSKDTKRIKKGGICDTLSQNIQKKGGLFFWKSMPSDMFGKLYLKTRPKTFLILAWTHKKSRQ